MHGCWNAIHTYDVGRNISRVEIAATAVIRDEKDFHGRAARKAAGIFREEVRADLHAVASLNKGENSLKVRY